MGEFRMPSLGADMEAGLLVEWLKHPGDHLKRGDVIAVVETQKGAIEVDVFETGLLERVLVEPGTSVPVGTPLAVIVTGGAEVPTPAPVPPAPVPPAPPSAAPPKEPPAAAPAPRPPARPAKPPPTRPLASPAARRIAAAHGIALAGLRGTGPGGAIVSRDVEALQVPAAPTPRRIDFAEMRRAIAAAMARSKREIPHYYLSTPIDLEPATRWLEEANAARKPADRLLLAAVLLKAVAAALGEMPEFNGFYVDGEFRSSRDVNLGVAIALRGGGLIAPAILETEKLTLDELMVRMRDLIGRARTGALRSSELSLPTITVTSLGDRGVEAVFGAIYPPQVALVGFGTPDRRPWVLGDQIVPRRALTATLAADHRVSDGHRGGLFLMDIGQRLQKPEAL
jgi:pyruvate dehydrogenase E2 component (dihydrolipoamide acetyltransferase)